jgi:hypothetical protein
MKRIYPRIQAAYHALHQLFLRMKKKDEKMDELSLRRQLAGAC